MTALNGWANFYVIAGSAAGALIGLQFVVMTLIANIPITGGNAQTGDTFSTPTVVHFGVVLLLSAAISAPWNGIGGVAMIWGLVGLAGLVYVVLVARRLRLQTAIADAYQVVFEDWLFPCSASPDGLRYAGRVGLCGCLAYTPGLVPRGRCGSAAALQRYSQRLGHHHLPRPGEETGTRGAERHR